MKKAVLKVSLVSSITSKRIELQTWDWSHFGDIFPKIKFYAGLWDKSSWGALKKDVKWSMLEKKENYLSMIHCTLFMNLPVCLSVSLSVSVTFSVSLTLRQSNVPTALSISITAPAKPHATLKFSLRLFWICRITKRYDMYIFQNPKNFVVHIISLRWCLRK